MERLRNKCDEDEILIKKHLEEKEQLERYEKELKKKVEILEDPGDDK